MKLDQIRLDYKGGKSNNWAGLRGVHGPARRLRHKRDVHFKNVGQHTGLFSNQLIFFFH